ncbi:MAG: endonuclease/exonuclease/phosphatase family protein, partial [Gammaproteobacteria bacterium]
VDAGPETLTLLWFNVNVGNPRRAAVLDYVERSGADAVALIEISDGWLEDLAALAASYPHRLVEPRGDGFGMALLSRRPLSDGTIAYHPAAGVPTISASLPLAGTPVRLHVVHPLAPVSAQMTRLRDRHLADLAFELAADSRSSVVLGDFNTTPYSRHYRRLARLAALTDCNRGHGLPLTWPTTTPVLRIPLDLCLASPDLLAIEATVGPDLGSDHLPRQVALARVQP